MKASRGSMDESVNGITGSVILAVTTEESVNWFTGSVKPVVTTGTRWHLISGSSLRRLEAPVGWIGQTGGHHKRTLALELHSESAQS